VVENNLIVEANHEEKSDEHCFISRSFKRRYLFPKDVEVDKVTSSLSPTGVLRIEAPKKAVEGAPKERLIPIQFNNRAHKAPAIQQQKSDSVNWFIVYCATLASHA